MAEVLAAARRACGMFPENQVRFARGEEGWRVREIAYRYRRGKPHRLTDGDLVRLSKLGGVEALTLPGRVGFTPTGLRKLAELKGLERLYLPFWGMEGADEYGDALGSLTALEVLSGSCSVAPDFSFVEDLPRLRRLEIAVASPADLAEKGIFRRSALEEIVLRGSVYGRSGTPSDAFLAGIRGLKRLRLLHVDRADASLLSALQGLPQLRELSTSELVPAAGLADLSKLKKLAAVELHAVTSKGQVRLPPRISSLTAGYCVLPRIDLTDFPMGLKSLEMHRSEGYDDYDEGLSRWRRILRLPAGLEKVVMRHGFPKEWEQLAGVRSLRELAVSGGGMDCNPFSRPVSDAALGHIGTLIGLERLDLSPAFNFTSPELADLLRKLPRLRRLHIQNFVDTKNPPAWLKAMGALKQLRDLAITTSDDDDHAHELAKQLRSLGELRKLRMNGVLTDEVLGALGELGKLQQLVLATALTDTQLMRLVGLKELQILDLSGSHGYTDAALAALVKALPALREIVKVQSELDIPPGSVR